MPWTKPLFRPNTSDFCFLVLCIKFPNIPLSYSNQPQPRFNQQEEKRGKKNLGKIKIIL